MSDPRDGSRPAGESSTNHQRGGEAYRSGDEDDPAVKLAQEELLDTHSSGRLGGELGTP